VDDVAVVSAFDKGEFIRRVEDVKTAFDNLLIIDGERCEFDLKEAISELMETTLCENENAKTFVEQVSARINVPCELNYARLPEDATLIPNEEGAYQGFVMDADEFTLAVLPEPIEQFKIMCGKYFLPYLKNKHNVDERSMVLKYFGDVKRVREVLDSAKEGIRGINYDLIEKYGDVTVSITMATSVDNASRSEFYRKVLGELRDEIYAEFDTTLGERLFDLLKLKNVRLSVAESFTGGKITSEMVKYPGISEYLIEGIVSYSYDSKMKRLGVRESSITIHGAASSAVAYEMTLGLLKGGRCDLAIATTGVAGPSSDEKNNPVGLGFIAVGMQDGVHTYRNYFDGTRDEIMEMAKNTALFLAIKKLKKI
jgi:nicotinamide-nucleotide amidase